MAQVLCTQCGEPMPAWQGPAGPWDVCPGCRSGAEAGMLPEELSSTGPSVGPSPEGLPSEIDTACVSAPIELAPSNYYLIVDEQQFVAHWENDGRGWMLHRKDGFVRVWQVAEEIPWFGQFVLVEIGVERPAGGVHLSHVQAYRLGEQFALMELVKSDHAILKTITGRATLSENQKDIVRDFVKSKYLRHVWQRIDDLL